MEHIITRARRMVFDQEYRSAIELLMDEFKNEHSLIKSVQKKEQSLRDKAGQLDEETKAFWSEKIQGNLVELLDKLSLKYHNKKEDTTDSTIFSVFNNQLGFIKDSIKNMSTTGRFVLGLAFIPLLLFTCVYFFLQIAIGEQEVILLICLVFLFIIINTCLFLLLKSHIQSFKRNRVDLDFHFDLIKQLKEND